jgi:hypothetical protein
MPCNASCIERAGQRIGVDPVGRAERAEEARIFRVHLDRLGMCGACANQRIWLTTPVPPPNRSSSSNCATSRGSSHRTAQRRTRIARSCR